MKSKQKISVINLILIILLGMCLGIGGLIIVLSKSKTYVAIAEKSTDVIKNSYTTEETTTNTWDISTNGDESVIATLADDGTLTISGTGEMKNWATNNAPWISNMNQIKCVKIQEGVTNIGKFALACCYNLQEIEIANSVTNIGPYAFYCCKELKTVEIPTSVLIIDSTAFDNCDALMEINVDENNTTYCDENGVLFTKDKTKILRYPAGKTEKEYKILDTVTIIEQGTFFCCHNLTKIEIPNTVTTIGQDAFRECDRLTDIQIPNSIITIGKLAFYECDSLISINIPSSVTTIGDGAFMECYKLTEIDVDINNENYSDENGVLYTKDKTEIITYPIGKKEYEYNILEGVTKIRYGTFHGCDYLTNVEIPNSVTSIERYAFFNCDSLNSAVIPTSVTSVGDQVFSYCDNLTNIEIPNNITNIADNVFDSSILTNFISTQSNVTELPNILKRTQEQEDFLNSTVPLTCTNCVIEDGKVIINEDSTYGQIKVEDGVLKNLTYIISYNTWDVSKDTESSVIANIDNNGLLTISGTGNMVDYETTSDVKWNMVNGQIKNVIIEEGVTNIGDWAFFDCNNVQSIKIPNTITNIGDSAFQNCKSLNELEIPSCVTNIGINAFNGCDNLTLICKINTAAEKYARENNINRIIIVDGIKPKTTVSEIQESLQNELEYEIVDLEGNAITDTSKVGTGYKVKMSDGEEYLIIVWGDFTGDGNISVSELARASRITAQGENVEMKERLVLDVSTDGKLEVTDLAVISRFATE